MAYLGKFLIDGQPIEKETPTVKLIHAHSVETKMFLKKGTQNRIQISAQQCCNIAIFSCYYNNASPSVYESTFGHPLCAEIINPQCLSKTVLFFLQLRSVLSLVRVNFFGRRNLL